MNPAQEADGRTLIRRAYFDLVGLPPSPESVAAFVGGDILKLSPSEIYASNEFRVIGNIPYNISSPILDWCEKHYEKILDMHFMLQKEFALRCAGNEKTSSYGRLSVICNYLYEVTILKEVSKEFFNPKPKVDSFFVRFSPKKKKVNQKELHNLKKVTRAMFNKKRKKISNSHKNDGERSEVLKWRTNHFTSCVSNNRSPMRIISQISLPMVINTITSNSTIDWLEWPPYHDYAHPSTIFLKE